MAKVVFCIATSEFQAEAIVSEAKVAGCNDQDISVLVPDLAGTLGREWQNKPVEGTPSGALGWLTGIGPVTIAGAGTFIAAGPIMDALSGAAAGSLRGGIAGALTGMGLPEPESRRYEQKIRAGSILISIRLDNPDQATRVLTIFEQANTQDNAIVAEVESAQPPELRDETWERW